MFRRLRTRIIFFFVALLALVQIAAFVLVNAANSTNARQKIEEELAVGQRLFARLLEQNRDRLAQTARVMAADYALREAIASKDVATVVSALRNHGGRINANMTMLVSMDGTVVADTFATGSQPRQFEFPMLIERARRNGSASSIELIDGHAYQVVVVPVLAPLPISWIVLGFVVDDALAAELRQLTTLEVSFLGSSGPGTAGGNWRALASTLDQRDAELTAALPALPAAIAVRHIGSDTDEQQIRVIPLDHYGETALVAVLQRSVTEAVAAFDNLRHTLIALGILSLLLSIAGSFAIALGITRPISELSDAAQRIRSGDYTTPVGTTRRDEIGVLADSLNHMRSGIATREQQILQLAYQDTLTEMPNRSLFNERLREAILTAQQNSTAIAVLVMDLDRFKYVNDTLGHAVGDHVLREVGKRLRQLLRKNDMVARLGGDEFAILIENADAGAALRIAHKILQALEQPIAFEEQPLDVGTSIGIAHFPHHGTDAGALLRNADIAMYVAKRNKSGFATYDPEYDTHRQEHLSLLSEIRSAVERDELRVHYQPKISLSCSAAAAVEALLRWQHPVRGFIPPAQFIPFAEQTGYIKVLTRWVLEESIRQCGAWHARGITLKVSINLSARDLMNRELPDQIAVLLQKYGTPASMICLEITESGFMEDPGYAQKVLERLNALGVMLSIDDYGTGYSSLSYIAKLPVDELKIDRSFVSLMARDPTTSMIVRSTIELGHSLGLKVVAEGVEDEQSLELLRELGCDHAQGYFMSRPLPPTELEEWLRTSRWGQAPYEPNATARIS
ncbi:MAG TPA: EAL domain-containing protein, partial [Povalibacter sp.]|nr:EAL domain-containing protein [Povalibacter sp.]